MKLSKLFGSFRYIRPDWATKRGMKFLWQKLTGGFSDEEIWALDWYLAKHILPRLKRFHKIGFERDGNWNQIMEKMIWSMEQIAQSNGGDFIHPDGLENDEITKYYARLQEGLTLFGKNFRRLWW